MEQITEWAESVLNNQGHIITGKLKKFTHTGSAVWEYTTNDGNFFLKYMTKSFSHELTVLEFLNSKNFQNLPKIIAKNNEATAFLTEDAGIPILKTLNIGQRFSTSELSKIYSILEFYSNLQIKCILHTNELLSFNVIDLRLQNLIDLYHTYFINNDDFLLSIGGNVLEIKDLKRLQDTFTYLCMSLQCYNTPQTLDHGDFHLLNLLQNGYKFTIIDFGDSAITHPFFFNNFLS
ncbi:unnamed protein product [Rotaria magnacalcarata]|uniref:Aminoglycoside phosphotransferase domain-containing protein n=1 Tax=Rotaria magnacalcarata TaxID=392030 RepID=A0A816QXI9_9BILA|nr:unnamed protein product [Rotaria magnacalcarata]CAF4102305.1 unnamed protein product [Rotaria magnacalcarata]